MRSEQKGQFEVKLVFRSVKGRNKVNTETIGLESNDSKPLEVHVLPPQYTKNLLLSIPHRLLALGLRTGVFANVETLDDVFNKDNHEFTVCVPFKTQ